MFSRFWSNVWNRRELSSGSKARRYQPMVERLESVELLSALVRALEYPASGGSLGVTKSSDSHDALTATFQSVAPYTGGTSTATTTATSLSVSATSTSVSSYYTYAQAFESWNFKILGVPSNVKVPLALSYQISGLTVDGITPRAQVSAAASATITAGSTQQVIGESLGYFNGKPYGGPVGDVSSTSIQGTFAGSGSLIVSLSAQAIAGGLPQSHAGISITLTGVSSPFSSQFPALAVQFDDGQFFAANPLRVSQGQLTFDAEGNDDPSSPYFSRQISWPGGNSGVTIGRGYDMGKRTPAQVIADLVAAGVSLAQAQAYAQGAGLTGTDAQDFVDANQAILGDITLEQQRALFEATYPAYAQAAANSYNKYTADSSGKPLNGRLAWANLEQSFKDVLTDMTYNGYSNISASKAAMTGNYDAFVNFLQTNQELNSTQGARTRNQLRIDYLLAAKAFGI